MKQIFFYFSIVCIIANTNSWTTSRFNSELIMAVWNHHDFPEPNVVVSSFAMISPLCALALASSGTTRKEIFDTLGFANLDEMNEKYRREITRMKDVNKMVPFKVASTLYVDEKLQINRTFKATIEQLYEVQVVPVNFNNHDRVAAEINKWVKKEMKEIPVKDTFFAKSISPQNQVLLVNTLHFKSSWQVPFSDAGDQKFQITKTRAENIPTITITMESPYIYVEDMRCQLILIPLQHKGCSFMIILPDKHMLFSHKHYTVAHRTRLNNATHYMKSTLLAVTLPKLKIETTFDLVETLKKLRIEEVFSEGNRLQDMLDAPQKLYVNQAYQKIFVDINESGINTNSEPRRSLHNKSQDGAKIVNIDRPFYFEIGCYATTLIGGIIMDPAHSKYNYN